MLLYWKFLLVLGTVFWVGLCLSEYLFSKDINYNTYICEALPFETEIIEDHNWLTEFLKAYIDLKKYTSFCEDYFNASLVHWIVLSFLCTIVIYFISRIIFHLIEKCLITLRRSSIDPIIIFRLTEPEAISDPGHEPMLFKEQDIIIDPIATNSDINLRKSNSISKIPVLVTRHEAQSPINAQEVPTNMAVISSTECNEEINKSCPNLTPKTSTTYNKLLVSLYDNKVNNLKNSKSVDRLRNEIVMLQATSYREQAILSRKLDAIIKEKRDLSIALANSLKENKNAKRKLEEIQKERSMLINQLESATNEIKTNTKSKRLTLTRLEKAIEESNEMKCEFTRLNEQKKILEEKVVSLNKECKEMKERRIILNKSYSEIRQDYDGESIMHDKTDDDSTSGGYYEVTDKQLHQSNIDMNKVQIKLNDLEKSLEKLKFSSTITKEREQFLQGESRNYMLREGLAIRNEFSHETIDECNTEDEEDSMQSQNRNHDYANAKEITSVFSLDLDDCPSLCLLPGCSREHNICDNPVCVYEHSIHDDVIPEEEHHGSERNLNIITSTNQIILEAVKEKSRALSNMSSLFDTKEARARLAAFFNVSLWKKDDSSNAIPSISDDSRLSLEYGSQETEFDYDEWSPRLVPRGIVSQSPAFQKFLSNVILDQRCDGRNDGIQHFSN